MKSFVYVCKCYVIFYIKLIKWFMTSRACYNCLKCPLETKIKIYNEYLLGNITLTFGKHTSCSVKRQFFL